MKKSKNLKAAIRKLDAVFSEYIRLRDSDKNGYCKCISCGAIKYWKDLDNGHFINRKHMSTRFSEKNCNAQCIPCNRFDEGNMVGYMRGLTKKYGEQILDELEAMKFQTNKLTVFEIDILIEDYIKKVKEFKSQKNLRE